jgi:hypothetical protein
MIVLADDLGSRTCSLKANGGEDLPILFNICLAHDYPVPVRQFHSSGSMGSG